jgi:hypothetical protein
MKFHPRERSHSLRGCLITALAFGIVTAISGSGRSAANAEEPLQFNRDVRPILSALCFQCHGFDQKTREAGLRLDTREGALAEHDGRAAIRPKEPEASELLRRITSTDPEVVMPKNPLHRLNRKSSAAGLPKGHLTSSTGPSKRRSKARPPRFATPRGFATPLIHSFCSDWNSPASSRSVKLIAKLLFDASR